MSDPNWRKRPRKWSPAKLRELSLLIDEGLSDAEIAERLGVTVNAVHVIRKRKGIAPFSKRRHAYSARGVAQALGIPCAKTVAWWISQGYLKGSRGHGAGPYRRWVIQHHDLIAFLEDRRYWQLWDPERISAESGLRWWAAELRSEQFLTTGQVAWRLCVTVNAVGQWIRKGLLPAVRHANWMIPASALKGFVPPGQRERTGRPRGRTWTPEEERMLLERRAQGWTWEELAFRHHRSAPAVLSRWYLVRPAQREAAA